MPSNCKPWTNRRNRPASGSSTSSATPRLQVDHGRKRDCPKCDGVKLKRHYFSAKKKVEVDQCPGCAGYWLDAGELEKIRDEMGQAAQLKELAAVRIDSAVIRYIYRMKTAARAEP
jgi:Zn-finger nucleic acid-binding protein